MNDNNPIGVQSRRPLTYAWNRTKIARRAIVTVEKLRRSSTRWPCGRIRYARAKHFNYYYPDDYCAGENSRESLRAISARLHARGNLACENTRGPSSFIAARSVATLPATVLFAYTEDHADVRLPFINFRIDSCVFGRCDSIMRFLGSGSRIA